MVLKTGIQWLILLWSGLGFFLSLWILVPAPTYTLLALSVGAPELSLWFLMWNAIALLLIQTTLPRNRWRNVALSGSAIGLVLSLLPLLQLPATEQRANAAMQQALGESYLTTIPQPLQPTMRPHPFSWLDLFTGLPKPAVRYTSGIQFASPDDVPLTLDLYRPLQVKPHPAIVTLYGGAWQHGSPSDNADFNRYMAAQGYTVLAIDYRHAPRYRFPAQLQDVQSALTFIQQHAAEYEVDLNHVALLGRSAGAHLALLAAYQSNLPNMPIQAVVDYYGPTDLVAGYTDLPHPDPIQVRTVLETLLGGSPAQLRSRYQQASPINYVKPNLPPTLLIRGDRDHIVKAIFSQQLFDRLQETDNTAVLIELPWAEHAFDAIFRGLSSQVSLYYTERFLAWALQR
jgi:acetyl esterase/lipase